MKHIFSITLLGIVTLLSSCGNKTSNTNSQNTVDSKVVERNKEAREDSLKMAEAQALRAKFKNAITADYETPPVLSEIDEDAADDPAIWINKKDTEKSLIFGTNKKAGLHVYDIYGKELQFIHVGKINNAECGYGLKMGNRSIDYVACTNRTTQTIDVYEIDQQNLVLKEKAICKITSTVDDVYGFCTYFNQENGKHYLFANGKNGLVEQWLLSPENDTIKASLVRTLQMPSQPEGMVVDAVTNTLFIGVEENAIFAYSALEAGDKTGFRITESSTSNPNISYDIEGLTTYRISKDKGYLIASIQGNFSYAIFDINPPYSYITSFIVKDGVYDGIEETDGLEICNTPMGPEFPKGILVVQDGFNKDNGENKNQNFKIISAQKVLEIPK
ncbi:phytase [Plebeiibacterium sediminum]|uniref:Phytase n=1 Tax=Plebeiibacterium sediminum TaxID=2992112 RepID=A0AAE3M774_9BACT|nr:phytase [Plebeiobacterium sediminum]MCW3788090.1 phytase [Plebeiobacterium sediminum]